MKSLARARRRAPRRRSRRSRSAMSLRAVRRRRRARVRASTAVDRRRRSARRGRKILLDVGIAILLAGSLNIVNGYAGQFSIGHAGFMLVGGYARRVAHVLRLDPLVRAPRSRSRRLPRQRRAAVPRRAACSAALVAAVARARRRPAVAAAARRLPRDRHARLRRDRARARAADHGDVSRRTSTRSRSARWSTLANNLGGAAAGFVAGPDATPTLFFVYLFVAIVLLVLAYRLKYSSKGRALLAVRENEIAAEAMGVDTTRAKVVAFVFVGVLRRHRRRAVRAPGRRTLDPKELGFQKSIDIVIMVVLGGMGSITGVVLGAAILDDPARGVPRVRRVPDDRLRARADRRDDPAAAGDLRRQGAVGDVVRGVGAKLRCAGRSREAPSR